MDEIDRYHAETLRHVIEKVNADVAEHEKQQRAIEQRRQHQLDEHHRSVDDIADRLDFG